MSRSLLLAVFAAFGVATFAPADAADQVLNVKVGLWEVTNTGQATGAPPVDTSTMPPERAARMEAAMKAAMANAAKPRSFKRCITKEKLEKDPFQEREEANMCKRTYLTRTSSVFAFKEECATEGGKTTAEGRFEVVDSENMKGTVETVINRAGREMTMNNQLTGKFISASCGDVK
jgi:hypothetical protein